MSTKLPPLTIVPASAGAGKTYWIQETLTQWVLQGKVAPERIAAVTFTEAAAEELRLRIRKSMMQQADLDIDQVLKLDQAYISTLHAFGMRIIEEYCFEGGWSPQPRKLSEEEEKVLIRQALSATNKADIIISNLKRYGYQWDFTAGSAEDQLRSQLERMLSRHRLIGREGVAPELTRELVQIIRKTYGRTRDAATLEGNLKKAIASLLKAFPEPLVDLYPNNGAFTKKVTEDYRALVRAHKTNALSHDWDLWKSLQNLRTSNSKYPMPEGYDDKAQAIMDAARKLHLHPGPRDDAITHVTALAGAAQHSLAEHAQLKRKKGLIDYGDMLSLANQLLQRHPDVLDDLTNRIDCLVIDEFQDTNPLQFSLMWTLHRQGIPMLVVGDVKQAIMGFQDADSRLLAAMAAAHPEACAPLDSNWRTRKRLMDFLNAASQKLFEGDYQPLKARADFTSKLEPLRMVNLTVSQSQDAYARHSAAQIKQILDDPKARVWDKSEKTYRPVQGSDIAVLLPTHALIEKYAEALRALGCQVQVEEYGWFESRSVQLAYYALAYAADPSDVHADLYLAVTELGQYHLEDALKQLISGQPLEDPILSKLEPLSQACRELDATAWVNTVIDTLDLHGIVGQWPDGRQHRANLLRLVGEAEAFVATNPETLEAAGLYGSGIKTFLAWLNQRVADDDSLPRKQVLDHDAIQLSTWHSAKGREWPIVAVCGTYKEYNPRLPDLSTHYQDFDDLDKILEKARLHFLPKFDADETNEAFLRTLTDEAEQNARRLLYVAITRSREMLILERYGWAEDRDKNTYWNLFHDTVHPGFEDDKIFIGKSSFPCKQIEAGKTEPAVFSKPAKRTRQAASNAVGRPAIKKSGKKVQVSPDTLNPSMLPQTKPPRGLKTKTARYGKPLDIQINRPPAETGTILHRCFEILTTTEDRTQLLDAATGYSFSNEEKQKLQNTVAAFENWLTQELGAIDMHKEVPISYINATGAVVNGTIDLLVETRDGYWILDHKTTQMDSAEEMNKYWCQLMAYSDSIGAAGKRKPALAVGINFITESSVLWAATT